MELLQATSEHRAVDLVEQTPRDVDDAAGIDAEEVSVVGKMVDRAQRDAVDDDRGAARIAVVDDVRRLQQRCLAQPADRAARGVRAQHCGAEAVLMQPDDRLARRVASDVFAGNKAGGRGVGDRKAGLELDELGAFVDGDDERGRATTAYWPGAMPRK